MPLFVYTDNMYHLKLHDKEVELIQFWGEMTLAQAEKVYKIMDHMPESLEEIYKATMQEQTDQAKVKLAKLHKKVTTKETIKKYPEFYGKIICALSNITNKEMEHVLHDSRTEIYQLTMDEGVSCESVVMGLMGYPFDYTPQKPKSFDWKKETLLMPQARMQLGQSIPMADEQVITFAEATDLQVHAEALGIGKYKAMANIISILCRPKDEEYDEDRSLKRAETMMKLPMDTVWEVFFCIMKHYNMLGTHMWTYLLEGALKAREQVQRVA